MQSWQAFNMKDSGSFLCSKHTATYRNQLFCFCLCTADAAEASCAAVTSANRGASATAASQQDSKASSSQEVCSSRRHGCG